MTAGEEIGDAIFLLFARDFAPLPERLATIAARLEAVPLALTQVRDRLGDRSGRAVAPDGAGRGREPAGLPGRHRGGRCRTRSAPGIRRRRVSRRRPTGAKLALADYGDMDHRATARGG